MSVKYIEIPAAQVPEDIRWDVPARNQGQIVEVAYGDHRRYGSEANHGAPYKRVTDHSEGSVTYYRYA